MNQTVLIIDDSPDIHRIIEVRGRDLDVRFVSALDAEEGFALAASERPDLILLDVDLGEGTSGFDLCERLKSTPVVRDVPVIFLTGEGQSDSKIRAFDIGAVDYVVKPFNHGELLARMRSALRTKHLVDMLAECANLDGLTGLRNRRYFDERLAQEVETVRRHDCALTLIIMDIDKFKTINDTLGHPRGDQVIQALGQVIQRVGRMTDIPCRLGGDEFVLMLPQTDTPAVEVVAERLCEAVRSDETLNRLVPNGVTCSVGLASTSMLEDLSADALIEAADQALYASKRGGRDRWTAYERGRAAA
ncbi:diguanylate cyclase [Mucisphaera calidilacus]|uniref:diguanylate cyclase n=1 Tax=Mucisphaera calidilacus TaxID=2527982 RepID=A0A518C1B9_9BACT|nr:diguanylate cyclase [Mucisphaera calidilacus]QDU73010.1 Response regulator PleD [Mucisphaera calidilacus]